MQTQQEIKPNIMAKKATAKAAPKSKPAPKAAPKATAAKKVEKKATPKAQKAKIPSWLKPRPTDYVVGTEEYVNLVAKHNELFNTAYNTHRVRPAILYGIFEAIWKHYDPEQFKKIYQGGFK